MKYPNKSALNRRISTTTPAIDAMISQIDRLCGQWVGGANLSPQILGRLQKSTLITSAGSSTRIEGAQLSDEEIEQIILGTKFDKMADRDSQEVRGYYEALAFVLDNYNNIPLSENYILELHAKLLKYSDKDVRHRGDYKKLTNSVKMYDPAGQELATIFKTSPPLLVQPYMRTAIEWFNDEINDQNHHPLLVIAGFIVELLSIHPFQDGNGRLSRLLTNLLMLRAGLSYVPYVSNEQIIEQNKPEYYLALRRSQATLGKPNESIEPWLEFFLRVCLAQAEQATSLLTGENIRKTLSPNQIKVLDFIRKVGEANVKVTVAVTGIKRPTVKQAYDKLLALKLVERIGLGRSSRYTIISK
jgi:Fic family protein